ncbi:MAG: type I methionyl aminopeptidase [Bacteroidetes bacterium]|nr:MAG: type I methionyl aminopeptidase [Bacteroidota bacterium]
MGKTIYLKTNEEIELIRESCWLVSKTISEIGKHIKEGISTIELDRIAEEFIRDNRAKPAFKGYRKGNSIFDYTLCVSVNEQVVHGIPGSYVLKNGDVVSVDCGVLKNGFYGDSAYTFAVGEISDEAKQLLRVTLESLYKGVENAVAGKRVGDISNAVEEHVSRFGYGIVRELVGHGIGRSLHEAPEVPNYGKRGSGVRMEEGLVIAIEPMINMGKRDVKVERDGWTVSAVDRKPSAHFEHTVAVKKGSADILTTFEFIEQELKLKTEKSAVNG